MNYRNRVSALEIVADDFKNNILGGMIDRSVSLDAQIIKYAERLTRLAKKIMFAGGGRMFPTLLYEKFKDYGDYNITRIYTLLHGFDEHENNYIISQFLTTAENGFPKDMTKDLSDAELEILMTPLTDYIKSGRFDELMALTVQYKLVSDKLSDMELLMRHVDDELYLPNIISGVVRI